MDRTLWIVSGGAEAVPGICRAKDMGLFVVVSDGDPYAPGFDFADHSEVVSTYDISGTVEAAKRFHRRVRPITGVICIASDVPHTVAGVAEELGLPGIGTSCAFLAMDKLAMKEKFREEKIPIPWFAPVDSVRELKSLVKNREGALVIKPVDSRGARGVLKLVPGTDLKWAFQYSRLCSPTSRVMVEEFLQGSQVSTESVLLAERAYTPGFSDRNYEFLERFAPFVIENGGQQPTSLSPEKRAKIAGLAERAGRALGIENWTVKGDMVLTPEGPKVIEMAARLSGGWFCTDQIPLATGVDLVGAAIQLALGDTPRKEELTPKWDRGVAIRYFFPSSGRVKRLTGVNLFHGKTWVHRLGFFVREGEILEPVTDHTKRAGFVITIGKDRLQAVERAERVCREIHIEMERV